MTAAHNLHFDTLLRRRRLTPVDVPNLSAPPGLADVEVIMHRLAQGSRVERTGDMVREHLGSGGKRIRARLALAAQDALGGTISTGVAWAAAVELLHNATLVHDDIQDGDRLRRGAPTLWAVHGVAQAINAGDLLLMLPYLALEPLESSLRGDLAIALASYAARVVRGQVEELDMTGRGTASWAAYERAARGKTAALMALPVHGAALASGRSRAHAATLGAAFESLGVLFQIQDDILDLYGDKGRHQPGADIAEGKVSALVVAHIEAHPEEGPGLMKLLAADREATSRAAIEKTIERFRSGGALSAVLDRVDALALSVREAEALRTEPALQAVALQLVDLVIHPIDHVREMCS